MVAAKGGGQFIFSEEELSAKWSELFEILEFFEKKICWEYLQIESCRLRMFLTAESKMAEFFFGLKLLAKIFFCKKIGKVASTPQAWGCMMAGN